MNKSIITIVLLNCFLIGSLLGQLTPKQLAGEPSEFSSFYLPNPQDVAQSSDSSLLTVSLLQSKTTDNVEWIGTIPVDSFEEFSVTFFSNFNDQLEIQAFPPSSKKNTNYHRRFRYGGSLDPEISNGTLGIDGNVVYGLTYTWDKPILGDWTIKVSAPSVNITNSNSNLVVLVQNPSNLKVYSYLSSYNNLFVGETINIVAMIYDDSITLENNKLPTAVKLQPSTAQINLVAPDGQSSVINMFDDGLHGDFGANDGVFGGSLVPNELGNYEAQIFFKGASQIEDEESSSSSSSSPSFLNLVRSNQHIIPITNEYLVFGGEVIAEQDSQGDVTFYFEVEVDVPENTTVPSVRVYSEIWGADNTPIAWIGGVSSLTNYQNLSTLSAFLDQRWIALANATAPFSVKNIIISDLNTFIPLSNQSTYSQVKLASEYKDVRQKTFTPPLSKSTITKDMRDGKMPKHLADRYGKNPGGNGKLILVHGYCADNNPWPISDFTNSVQFEDFSQNRPNDEFAKLVGAFGEQFADGFSLLGHSQGGNQGLHLFTYYHTGLDLSTAYPGYVLQSVGTPYQGTELAGTLASIGNSVGVGCSSNNDLTLDGAALWLNSIPSDKRSYVYYTTTQYKTGGIVNYCSLPANAVLDWPNDGVVDVDHSTLSGGNYVQNIKGWCHTDDMKSPPQTSNTANNQILNQNSVW